MFRAISKIAHQTRVGILRAPHQVENIPIQQHRNISSIAEIDTTPRTEFVPISILNGRNSNLKQQRDGITLLSDSIFAQINNASAEDLIQILQPHCDEEIIRIQKTFHLSEDRKVEHLHFDSSRSRMLDKPTYRVWVPLSPIHNFPLLVCSKSELRNQLLKQFDEMNTIEFFEAYVNMGENFIFPDMKIGEALFFQNSHVAHCALDLENH